MEEDVAQEFFDNPKKDELTEPKDFVINPAARPERRVCVYISRDDKNTDISKE